MQDPKSVLHNQKMRLRMEKKMRMQTQSLPQPLLHQCQRSGRPVEEDGV
jgi:hypothetical protein